MRQPQHRNRARTRSRRQPNPANKVYESNGPDVKVRGTPQQVADKYMQLGRDALSSGDAIKAENYFQHAEHYLRIIAAAQEQAQQRRAQQEQRRQEAAARRRGNNGAEPDTADTAGAGDPASAQVVVLPTDAAQPETGAAATEEGAAEASWDGAPEFLTRPVETDAGNQASSGEQPENARATPRKASRSRRAPRTRKGNGAAASRPRAATQDADGASPCAPAAADAPDTPANGEEAGKAD